MLFSLDKLYSPAQARAIDRAAALRPGCTGTLLMERAGTAAYSMLRRLWPAAQRLGVVCGVGNNGGDGYVLARLAHLAGLDVHLTAVAGAPRTGSEADTARQWFLACGGHESAQLPAPDTEVLVDGLLGTGMDRAPEGATAQAIDALNASGRPVLALDLPSGLHADTGDAPGRAVRATATLSFVVRKRGLYTGKARALCGQLAFDALGVTPDPDEPAAEAVLLDLPRLRAAWLPPRARQAHKGDFGHVLVIGGDHGFGGAARLAGTASARAGAGLTTVATRPAHVPALLSGRPELMAHGLDTPAQLTPLLDRADRLAIGPGLGQEAFGRDLWARALACGKPLVADADALNLLAGTPQRRDDWILTPHPGEAARLLGCSPAQVEADRFAAVRALHARYGGVVVLKGAGTLVCDGTAPIGVVPGGNPGLASGGTGDVLTGLIAGLWAQGLSARQAAALGASVHAATADALAARHGERGLLAGDLAERLPALLNETDDGADLGA
ncbi:NAD(P)H-hydrate dehydratase [Immundisolibacter sp.]|uniref:NAD(P)H-hydrate dehydratase n=1 Tax=Immundisolibacter sp. TaxID=1934948 RepID=UPI003F868DCC